MNLCQTQVRVSRVRAAITSFEAIRDGVDEMAASYPVVFDTLSMLVAVSDTDFITVDSIAANAIYWVEKVMDELLNKCNHNDSQTQERKILLEGIVFNEEARRYT